ncbi:MAG: hypothetical protein E7389_02085 [Ruminococcaceae bacterium]|jgi:hypothetical protein|nr:hypothetical protein [Oscillospiraceae bacterium]
MKLRRLICFIITLAVVMTTAMSVSVLSVSAEKVSTAAEYKESFDYAVTDYQKTLLKLKDDGWYMADHKTLYTNVAAVAPYSSVQYKLARITTKDSNMCLQIVSAGEKNSTDNSLVPTYGYGKTFPGVEAGEAATGVWEINFDFKPALIKNGTQYSTQFSFTFNTGDGSASSDTIAQHNIISGYGQRFYLGYRDYKTLYTHNVTQGTIKAADVGGETWYRVKTILNCDAHYYSVELYNRATGKLIARRCPISFAADETIGFVKFSALGFSQNSYVYVDNVSIEKATREATIYNETFDSFTNAGYLAADGMKTGVSPEDFTGDSYFEGNTPWRFHESIGGSYALENDSTLPGKVARLGDLSATEDITEASGLVYMQIDEPLINQTTENSRGTLKASFKIKPETIVSDVTLNVIPGVNYDITSDEYAVFKITNNFGTPNFVKPSGEYVTLDASKWYDVDIAFNVVDRKVTTVIKDLEGNEVANCRTSGNKTPNAVRAVMIKADGGSSVLTDDIKLEYYTPAPSVDISKIVLKNSFGEKITDTDNVTTALKSIEIPFGCPISNSSAGSAEILLTDSNGNTVPCAGAANINSYTVEPTSLLALNEEYTLTIPKNFANAYGDWLGKDVTFTFKTSNKLIDISALSLNGKTFSSLSDVKSEDTVNVTMSYANSTESAINSKIFFAMYGADKLLNVQSADFAVQAGAHGTDSETVAFTVPSEIDMDNIDIMSVFVLDGFKKIKPLTQNINVKRKRGEARKFKDYVDFEVNVESGRDAVVLQITDPQIIDSKQVREGVEYSQEKANFWMPELMDKRLFNDLGKLIEEVNPDLILVTGDLVYGGYDDAGTSFTKLADFMDGYNIPWAPVFGNHENESKKGVDWQCEYLENCKNCLFKQRTLTGNGNYSIGVIQGGELKRVVFMLDSNGCAVMSDESLSNGHSKTTAGFGDDQIEWYTSAAEKINSNFDNIKYTFAFHIQLAAFEDAFHKTYGFVNGGDVDKNGNLVSPINIDEREDKKDTDFGYIGRNLKGPWDSDKAVYNGIKALGADSILVGHEHCNSASVVYDGIRFQYGQKIGEYDRINFRSESGQIIGFIAIASNMGTPILGGTVMELSEQTGEISKAYIHYCSK